MRNKKIIFVIGLIFIVVGLIPFAITDLNKEKNIQRGPNWNKVCEDGSCNLSIYSGLINYLEDGEYVPIDTSIRQSNFWL